MNSKVFSGAFQKAGAIIAVAFCQIQPLNSRRTIASITDIPGAPSLRQGT
jgi:hypothetical protein